MEYPNDNPTLPPTVQSPSGVDIAAVQEALPRIKEECSRLFAEPDFSLPPSERTQRLIDQLLALAQELRNLCGFVFSDLELAHRFGPGGKDLYAVRLVSPQDSMRVNFSELETHNLNMRIYKLFSLLHDACDYARSETEPVQVGKKKYGEKDSPANIRFLEALHLWKLRQGVTEVGR